MKRKDKILAQKDDSWSGTGNLLLVGFWHWRFLPGFRNQSFKVLVAMEGSQVGICRNDNGRPVAEGDGFVQILKCIVVTTSDGSPAGELIPRDRNCARLA